jgi:hypothetical protein
MSTLTGTVQQNFIAKWIPFRALGPALWRTAGGHAGGGGAVAVALALAVAVLWLETIP